jgi:hypothetical protein
MPTLAELQAQDEAYNQQAVAQRAQEAQQKARPEQPPSLLAKWTAPLGRVTGQVLDSVVSEADQWGTAVEHVGRSLLSGAITGATNIMDRAGAAVKASGEGLAAAEDPEHGADARAAEFPTSPIWEHAKSAILDFRDAVAVKDPTWADPLIQGVGQLAVPFAAYSRALAGLHGFANVAAAGALTDATALQPHDVRMADVLAAGRQTEGKLGAALQTLAPDGSALNAYINYLADRTNETEAEGTFKNVLDGFGTNLIVTPLLHSVAMTLKHGQAGLRYMADNGVGSFGDFFPTPGSARAQRGSIGWHGTPHDFDTARGFDNEAIGSGEGAQVYGYGHYLAEDPTVARHYQQTLTAGGRTSAALRLARQSVLAAGGDEQKAVTNLTKMADAADHPNDRAHYQTAAQIVKAGNAKRGGGSIVKAEVDDKHVANMLDWDEPISKQPKAVQEALAAHGLTDPAMLGKAAYRKLSAMLTPKPLEGSDYFSRGDEGSQAASALLNFRGVPGIKYLDAGSRKAGGGTRNLVVFDGKNIKVLEKGK